MLVTSFFTTPTGMLEIIHDEHYIFNAAFTEKSGIPADTKFAQLIGNEISAYFKDPQHRFQLQLKPQGSIYQQKVWNALLVIPTGRTLTYGELSNKLQSSPRAVGQACKRNPIALFIPCHRVVGKTDIGGYMGNPHALPYKRSLLAHENNSQQIKAMH